MSESAESEHKPAWVWWVCGLLFLASTINYLDRQTLVNTSVKITAEFQLTEKQYGTLELAFGLAFAAGASLFGFVADRTNIRWLYPIMMLLWSAMGCATGWATTYTSLLLCRMCLGLFEAAHWPCALKTTQRLLPPSRRTLGNSVLQSGTAIGAVLSPMIIRYMVSDAPGSWRPMFQIVGSIGGVWVALWLITIRSRDLQPGGDALVSEQAASADRAVSFRSIVFSRRFLILLIVVVSINVCSHQFRVWMPKFLESGRGFSHASALDINTWYNIMTDAGCIAAGLATAALHRRGATVYASRCWVFAGCTLLVATGASIPWLQAGSGLVAVLMLVGLGSLGLFPCYYAFTQELSTTHQGKVVGALATCAWIAPSLWHREFGAWVDRMKSYDLGMCVASLLPLIALGALFFFWPRERSVSKPAIPFNSAVDPNAIV